MIKSYKIVLIVQFFVLLVGILAFNTIEYAKDFVVLSKISSLLIGFSSFILLAISIVIQRLVVAVIYSDSIVNGGEKENELNNKFWKNSFLIYLTFAAVTFILFAFFVILNFEIKTSGFHFVNKMAVFFSLILGSSLVIGLFLIVKDIVNEVGRLLGDGLMILISILIFGSSLFLGVNNLLIFQFSSDEIETVSLETLPEIEEDFVEPAIDTMYVDEKKKLESEPDYYGFRKMSFPEIKANEYLKELIHNREDDSAAEYILKIFLSNFLRLEKGLSFSEIRRSIEAGSDSHGFADIKDLGATLRKNPEYCKEAFNSYSPLIYSFLSDEIYYDSNLDRIVNTLIKSYDDIYKAKNPDESFEKIYRIMILGAKKEFPDYYFYQIKPYASEEVLNLITENENVYSDNIGKHIDYKCSIIWVYSFWARRYKEKNIAVTYDILKKIQQHYKQSEE